MVRVVVYIVNSDGQIAVIPRWRLNTGHWRRQRTVGRMNLISIENSDLHLNCHMRWGARGGRKLCQRLTFGMRGKK